MIIHTMLDDQLTTIIAFFMAFYVTDYVYSHEKLSEIHLQQHAVVKETYSNLEDIFKWHCFQKNILNTKNIVFK